MPLRMWSMFGMRLGLSEVVRTIKIKVSSFVFQDINAKVSKIQEFNRNFSKFLS